MRFSGRGLDRRAACESRPGLRLKEPWLRPDPGPAHDQQSTRRPTKHKRQKVFLRTLAMLLLLYFRNSRGAVGWFQLMIVRRIRSLIIFATLYRIRFLT